MTPAIAPDAPTTGVVSSRVDHDVARSTPPAPRAEVEGREQRRDSEVLLDVVAEDEEDPEVAHQVQDAAVEEDRRRARLSVHVLVGESFG